MTRYPLERVGSLLVTKAAISGPTGVKVVRLLVDTGSVYTEDPVVVAHTLPFGSLVDGLLGMDVLRPLRATILLADGMIEIP